MLFKFVFIKYVETNQSKTARSYFYFKEDFL
nr:MAG TPA: hypothetical protein [Caudoviricetes sp.]